MCPGMFQALAIYATDTDTAVVLLEGVAKNVDSR